MTRDSLSSLLEILGVVCVLAGAAAVDWRLGVILLGALLTVVGYLLADAPEVDA